VAIKNTQHIYDLVNLCAQYGVEKAVVCPGSRCAPLLIGFGKHPDIETISITDERSAGFIGLGIAQQSCSPVALVCTSGTAAQNFAPAVTEAYYQQVPLIVLTADRPAEWIDQWDGQTIHQKEMYKPHIVDSITYNKDDIELATHTFGYLYDDGGGPIHLNIPIDEPFYPENLDDITFNPVVMPIYGQPYVYEFMASDWFLLEHELISAQKVMILGGQNEKDPYLIEELETLDIPIVGDVISNLHGIEGVINLSDLVFNLDNDSMAPDVLITFGRSIISKNLKLLLRKYPPKLHWHMGYGKVGDPFRSLTKTFEAHPIIFFNKWKEWGIHMNDQTSYQSELNKAQIEAGKKFHSTLDNSDFNYFSAVQKIIRNLPDHSILHLGNSMPVRIANFIGLNNPSIDVWCNRGTSGIDGVVSTAVGHALAESERKHTLIIGDLSFFYDRNGLWLNHDLPSNLQIVILNDGGGGIFNMIPGPSNQEGLTDLFTTPHNRTAELSAKEFGLAYSTASSLEEIHDWKPGILEIFTDMKTNTEIFNKIKNKI